MAKKPEIVVIGAGISGLASAYHLVQSGQFEVTVIEASDHIGGRINSKRIMGEVVELGANWVHGKVNNPIYDLAEKNNFFQKPNTKPVNALALTEFKTSDGEFCDAKIVQEVASLFRKLILEAYDTEAMRKLPQDSSEGRTLGNYLRKGFDDYLRKSSDNIQLRKLKESIFKLYEEAECNSCGCGSLTQLNLQDFGGYIELAGGNCVVYGGYEKIPRLLYDQLGEESVIFKHQVTEITWQCKELPHETNQNSYDVKILCENGKQFYANHVIVTLPLGVLKAQHSHLFHPPLPSTKVSAIENQGFGTVNKILLEFEKPFWNSGFYKLNLLWDKDESSGADHTYPAWVYGLYTFFTPVEGSAILLGWLHGDKAEEVEHISIEEITKNCVNVISRFTGIHTKSLPIVLSCHRTQWHSNPFSKGSYSYIACESKEQDIEVLASPLPSPSTSGDYNGVLPLQIMFAGEATHCQFYSTVHGAYLSGIRETNRLINHYLSRH